MQSVSAHHWTMMASSLSFVPATVTAAHDDDDDDDVAPSSDVVPVLDALPYVDVIHEDYEQYASSLIEDEMARSCKPPATTLSLLKPIESSSSILLQEYNTITGEDPPRELYQSQELVSALPPTSNDKEEWLEAIKKLKVAYEMERTRGQILELESKYASNQWRLYLEACEQLQTQQTALLNQQQSLLDNLNASRQEEQVEAGKMLQQLQSKYWELLNKRHALQCATLELEREVNALQHAASYQRTVSEIKEGNLPMYDEERMMMMD